MPVVEISSTNDVPIHLLETFIHDINKDAVVAGNGPRLTLDSIEPPSWVTLIVEADWWIQALGAIAAVYVAEIAKEAGKDTWRNRAKIISSILGAGGKIWELVNRFRALKQQLPSKTICGVALRIGQDSRYDDPGISIDLDDINVAVLQLALLTHHVPALMTLITERDLRNSAASGIHLFLQEDGSLSVTWLVREGNEFVHQNAVLPIKP